MEKVTILGGDRRSFLLGQLLAEDGKQVTFYGFDKLEATEPKLVLTLEEAIEASDILIGPLPFTNKKGNLNVPYSNTEITLAQLFQQMNSKQILLGGHIPKQQLNKGRRKGLRIIDYFVREELQWLNAIPTVEGALQLAMEKQDITIHGSNVFVLGFGRIGKVLADRLYHLGAKVHVVARKFSDLAVATAYRYEAVHLEDFDYYLHKMDTIFNTVPAILLTDEKLQKVDKNCILIDLASQPGGIDRDAARQLNLETYLALGLPGKVAPLTAARCIRKTIYNILIDLEVST